MRKKLIFSIPVMEVEIPFSSIGQSISDERCRIDNDWIYQIYQADSGMGFSNMSIKTSCTDTQCLAKARSAGRVLHLEHGITECESHEIIYLLHS